MNKECVCAEINSRNCPVHQNISANASESEPVSTPQWEIDFDKEYDKSDKFITISENFSGFTETRPGKDEIKTFIKSTLEEVIEKIHECCDGECYHDDCCGKLSCVKAQLRKEFL